MSEENETIAPEHEQLPGESEYAVARKMPHNAIPDFTRDGLYLMKLGESAALGFARAMAKLGDYALRRSAFVEAYYWLYKARKAGMRGLDVQMRQIRKQWMLFRFPTEDYNRHDLFTDEDSAAALALLDLSLGRNREEAKAFLKEHFPDLHP